MKFIQTIWITMLVATAATAQIRFPKGTYFEASLHAGRIVRHTPRITIPIEDNTYGGELSWERRLYGFKPQQAIANYPLVGVAFSYQNFGDTRRIGHGFGLMPHISIEFIRKQRFRLYGRLGLGVGYVTKYYNEVTNPDNNIMGSHWCNNTALRFGAAWRVHRHWELRPTLSFTHYSNGASQLPNFGINVASFQLGVCYMPQPVDKTEFIKLDSLPTKNKRLIYHVSANLGMREYLTNGGPKYPVVQTSFDVGWQATRLHRFRVGVEYEYLGAVHAFLTSSGVISEKEARWQASRFSGIGGFEIMWGRVTLGANVGFYLTHNEMQPWFMFTRLTGRYYWVNPLGGKRVQPYVGLSMKSHRITAEYISIAAGTIF